MAVRPVLIFPSIAPICTGGNDDQRRMDNRRLTSGCFNQCTAMIAGAQPAQAKISGRKVINTSVEPFELTASYIKLYLIKRARTGRRSEIDLATRILPAPGDAGGKVEKLGDRFQIRLCLSLFPHALSNG